MALLAAAAAVAALGFGPRPNTGSGLYSIGDVVDIQGQNVSFSRFEG